MGMSNKVVGVDTPDQTILKWDKEGARIYWDFENFKVLPDGFLSQLSSLNRGGYLIAKQAADHMAKQEAERETGHRARGRRPVSSPEDRLDNSMIGGNAALRTAVLGGRPNTHYCLQRIEDVEACKDIGYDIVDGSDPVRTPGMTKVGGSRRISRNGKDEMILMKVPKERYDRHLQGIYDESTSVGARKRDESFFKASLNISPLLYLT